MSPQLKLLFANPNLNSQHYQQLESAYLKDCLGLPLTLPKITHKPFIFSCFALSVDGKLRYPDSASGFNIAKLNSHATPIERSSDWWTLGLARTISDAVIIGSNSLRYEDKHYSAVIDNANLLAVRQQLGKPEQLLHILLTRDLTKLNLDEELIGKNNELPVLIATARLPEYLPKYFKLTTLNNLQLTTIKQVVHLPDLDSNYLIKHLHNCGIKTILNESPYYHHHLQSLKLLDEAWLNISGVYIGGNTTSLGDSLTSFNAAKHPHYTWLTAHHLGFNFLYNRYRIDY